MTTKTKAKAGGRRKRSDVQSGELALDPTPIWQRNMNAEQLAAIMHTEGPARLLASAGSGKTRVVTHRIARLVEAGTPTTRILALTFSTKAAAEMKERTEKLGVRGCRIGTWHSLCIQILKDDKTRWAHWEVRESTKLELKEVLGWKGMDWKGSDVNAIASFISRCKANLFDPSSPEADAVAKKAFGWESKRALEAFHRYNELLSDKEILSYDDFLVFAAEHLKDERVRSAWAARWDFGIQDEAQDENEAQKHIARRLFGDHRNYMVVGDVDQSIYAFRGSAPQHLANFEKEWPGAVTYTLPRNYRSGRAVVSAANGIIGAAAPFDGYDRKPMIAERDHAGDVRALASETLDDEGNNFVGWIQAKTRTGEAKLSDFTALFRTNAQSRALEEALLGARIPYVVVGGTSFYERKEVRDILAYLRLACARGERDDVKPCINAPFRFLGAKFVERVMAEAERCVDDGTPEADLDWSTIVGRTADGERLQDRQRCSAREWSEMVMDIGAVVRAGGRRLPDGTVDAKEACPETILNDILKRTRYLEWIKKEQGEDSIETSGEANVRELVRVSSRFATCDELLDYVDETVRASKKQRDDKQAGGERVLLMSVHRSKGLEWPNVFVAGCNEMILPHPKGDLEEERRLAYVAVTRARDALVMSYVRTVMTRAGLRDAAPSRFIVDSGVRLDGPDDDVDELADAQPLDIEGEAEVVAIEGAQN